MKKIYNIPGLMAVLLMAVCAACSKNSGEDVEVKDANLVVTVYHVVDTVEMHQLFAGTPIEFNLTRQEGAFGASDTRAISERYKQYDSLFTQRSCAFRWMPVPVRSGSASGRLFVPIVIGLPALITQKAETVNVSAFPGTEDVMLTFKFKDAELWKEITAANVNKPLAVGINGRVLDCPVVRAPITDGTCFVVVSYDLAVRLLPGADLSRFMPKLVSGASAAAAAPAEEVYEVSEPVGEIEIIDDQPVTGASPAQDNNSSATEPKSNKASEPAAQKPQEDIVKIEDVGIEDIKKVEADEVLFTAEKMPEFKGGQEAMARWLSANVKYPQSALEVGIQGRVMVKCVVEKDGSLSGVQVVRGKDPALDKEALRLVRSMPSWTPGQQNGAPARVSVTIPITFRLPANGN